MTRKNQKFNCATLNGLRMLDTVRFIGQITESAWHISSSFDHCNVKLGSASKNLIVPGHLDMAQHSLKQKFRIGKYFSKRRGVPCLDSASL